MHQAFGLSKQRHHAEQKLLFCFQCYTPSDNCNQKLAVKPHKFLSPVFAKKGTIQKTQKSLLRNPSPPSVKVGRKELKPLSRRGRYLFSLGLEPTPSLRANFDDGGEGFHKVSVVISRRYLFLQTPVCRKSFTSTVGNLPGDQFLDFLIIARKQSTQAETISCVPSSNPLARDRPGTVQGPCQGPL